VACFRCRATRSRLSVMPREERDRIVMGSDEVPKHRRVSKGQSGMIRPTFGEREHVVEDVPERRIELKPAI